MSRRVRLLLGAVTLVVNALQWVIVEAVASAAWTDPPYTYAANYISDLGVPECGAQFQGRDICSPLHAAMNASFMLEGILFATGMVLLAHLVTGRTRRTVIALAIAHGVAMVLVGLFHGSPDGPSIGLVVHAGAAGIGILCANALVIMAGALRNLGLPTAYRAFSITVGSLGLLSEACVGLSPSTAGVFERGGVYSWLLWSVVTGTLLLVENRRDHRVVENVVA